MRTYPSCQRFMTTMTKAPVITFKNIGRHYKEDSMFAIICNARIMRLQGNQLYLSEGAKKLIEAFVNQVIESPAPFIQFWNQLLQPITPDEVLHNIMDEFLIFQRLVELLDSFGQWASFSKQFITAIRVLGQFINQVSSLLTFQFRDLLKCQQTLTKEATEFISSGSGMSQSMMLQQSTLARKDSINLSFESDGLEPCEPSENSLIPQIINSNQQILQKESIVLGQFQFDIKPQSEIQRLLRLSDRDQLQYINQATSRIKNFNNVKEIFYDLIQFFQIDANFKESQEGLHWICTAHVSKGDDELQSTRTSQEKKDYARSLAIADVLDRVVPLILKEKLNHHNMELAALMDSKGKFVSLPVTKKPTKTLVILQHIDTQIEEAKLRGLTLNYRDLHFTDPHHRRKIKTLLNQMLEFFKNYLRHICLVCKVDCEEGDTVSKISFEKNGTTVEQKFKIKANDSVDGHVKGLMMNIRYIVDELLSIYPTTLDDVIHYLQLQQ